MDIEVRTYKGILNIQVGAPFIESIMGVARELGIPCFLVYLNGLQVESPKDAPAVVEEGMNIALLPYDK